MTTTERACPKCRTPLPEAAQFCMSCGTATPTDPGVPPRLTTTGAFEVAKVTEALAGRYKIERVVGEGGMATVYLAEDQKHRRKVAVKVMRPELAATLGADRFLREVQIAAQLSHPHILPMHDSGEADGLLYYVMPYVEGETLRERLVRDGALAPEEALKLAREVADALGYAHARGFVHRDIKPANILLQSGHALVADFGIARAVEDVGGESLTKTGLAVGTPQYMAPEQATGEKDVDGRADLYAVGAMLYEMLTGAPPFTGANARSVLTKSLTEAPKRVSTARPGVPEVLDPILERALAKSADDRFQSAQEFVAAMDAVRGTPTPLVAVPAIAAPPTQVTGAVPAPRGLKRWLTPANLVIAVLAATVLFFALRDRGSTGDDGTPRGNRLVVLPFDNKGGQNDLYLVEGISQQVRIRLNRLGALQVIAAGSSDQYRDSKKTPQEISRELGADYILSASAQWSEADGGRLTLTPTLRDARSGKVRWEETLDVPAADLAKTPSNIAVAVARELGAKPSEAEQQELERLPTANAEAYRSFLRGAYLTGADPETIRQSIREYEQAVALDEGFAQGWALLSIRYANLLGNVSRTPANAERSKVALARAEALAPGADFVRRARYVYLSTVLGDQPAAIAELDDMLRTYPNDAALLATSANFDLQREELGTALAKLERARDLDPRQGNALASLSTVYVALGRYADAVQAGEALVAVRPRDLSSLQTLVIAHLASADLGGARAALKAGVQRGIPAPRMAAYMAAYQEVGFVLEESEQQLVLRLTPSAFDDDRSWWAQSLATLHWQRGDTALARAFADSAVAPTRELLAKAPEDLQQHVLLALMLGYLGRGAEARAEIERAIGTDDENTRRYFRVNAAKAELALENREAATAHIAVFRKAGHFVTPGWMQVDPTYASLKGFPPFEQLLKTK